MLDYFPNADHAPIYAAQANGDFKHAGLDVKIRQPADPSAPIKQVAAGPRRPGDLLRARGAAGAQQGPARGGGRRAGAQPLTSIISLPKAKIRTPADLKGKTVGTAGIDYQHAYLQTILDRRTCRRRASRSATWASTWCRRSSAARSTRSSAASGTTRRSTCAAQEAPEGHQDGARRRAPLRRARFVANADALDRRPADPPLPRSALRRGAASS